MRIGMIAPPWVTVPPAAYGGTEGVIDTLARGLTKAGHDVVLFTTADSLCPVERRWVYDEAVTPMGDAIAECRHVQAAYDALADCDLVHDHTTVGPVWAAARGPGAPVVTTVHCALHDRTRPVYARLASWVTVSAISRSQRDSAPEIPVAAVIHHGLDAQRHSVGSGSGGHAVFVGRCSPQKGADTAIEIARRAGMPLRIAAKMREPEELEYFHDRIEPLLGRDVEFLGEISPEERDEELASAAVLLNPIAWREPFGLVMIEAMASGTPVVAFAEGAAPEIVEHGVTGFLCSGVNDAVAAVQRIDEIDRRDCRAAVEGYFSQQRMTRDYLALYRRVLGRPASRETAGRDGLSGRPGRARPVGAAAR